jgi:hypothetical protein
MFPSGYATNDPPTQGMALQSRRAIRRKTEEITVMGLDQWGR